MAGWDLELEYDNDFEGEARDFIVFLRKAARLRKVSLKYRTIGPGRLLLIVDATPGVRMDGFLQELMLDRGLFYYACAISNRQEVVAKVIDPIFSEILSALFPASYARRLKRHMSGHVDGRVVPSEFSEKRARAYGVVFRKLDLRISTEYDFVKDADDILTEFLLIAVGHTPGKSSPKFHILLRQAARTLPQLTKDVRKRFLRIHKLRTRGLHRLQKNIDREELLDEALWVYFFFLNFDEFLKSQKIKTVVSAGRRYRRMRYGSEKWLDENDKLQTYQDPVTKPCHECLAFPGQLHSVGCDAEYCPKCHTQLLSCEHFNEDEDWGVKSSPVPQDMSRWF